jgi:hypothetical protein
MHIYMHTRQVYSLHAGAPNLLYKPVRHLHMYVPKINQQPAFLLIMKPHTVVGRYSYVTAA